LEVRQLALTDVFLPLIVGGDPAELGGRFSEAQLRETIDFLSNEGHLYSTIDEDHFKATSEDF